MAEEAGAAKNPKTAEETQVLDEETQVLDDEELTRIVGGTGNSNEDNDVFWATPVGPDWGSGD